MCRKAASIDIVRQNSVQVYAVLRFCFVTAIVLFNVYTAVLTADFNPQLVFCALVVTFYIRTHLCRKNTQNSNARWHTSCNLYTVQSSPPTQTSLSPAPLTPLRRSCC